MAKIGHPSLLDGELEDIMARNDEAAMQNWVRHHLHGDWYTSRLLRLLSTADLSNMAKLELAYPSIVSLWRWYKTGMNPRRQAHLDTLKVRPDTHAFYRGEEIVGEV